VILYLIEQISFFDFNEAIETNIASTSITSTLSIDQKQLLNFHVFPIPTENILSITSKTTINTIEVFNNMREVILKKRNGK